MGELKWTPSSVGSYTFYVMVEDGFLVEDGQGGFMKSYDLQSFTVTVVSESPADRLPQVSFRGESLVCIGETFSWDITATDEDADILEYQILGDRPDAMVITKLDNNHARLIWRPPTEYLGYDDKIRICVSDGRGGKGYCHIPIAVGARNSAPELVSAAVRFR